MIARRRSPREGIWTKYSSVIRVKFAQGKRPLPQPFYEIGSISLGRDSSELQYARRRRHFSSLPLLGWRQVVVCCGPQPSVTAPAAARPMPSGAVGWSGWWLVPEFKFSTVRAPWLGLLVGIPKSRHSRHSLNPALPGNGVEQKS